MKIDEEGFRTLLAETVEENPLACRGLLGISRVEFTTDVATAAVTLGDRPILQVNLDFVRRHCERDTDAKALLIHEFLHVLLRHTLEIRHMTRPVNIALDAVINAIIHRGLGDDYSGFMSRFYAQARGPAVLLRRIVAMDYTHHRAASRTGSHQDTSLEKAHVETMRWLGQEGVGLWNALYAGKALHEDVLEFLATKRGDAWRAMPGEGEPVFLGNHAGDRDFDPDALSPELAERLRSSARELACKAPLPGSALARPGDLSVPAIASAAMLAWERATLALLRKLITPDRRAASMEATPSVTLLPVIHAGDRRGVLRSLWNPLIGENTWASHRMQPRGTVAVYLDVSGSMAGELKAVTALLHRFERYLRRPFFAFANTVEPALFRNGNLVTKSTGGTSLSCVFEDLRRTRPGKALIITDGFVEQMPKSSARVEGTSIQFLLTSSGTDRVLRDYGHPIQQLAPLAAKVNLADVRRTMPRA